MKFGFRKPSLKKSIKARTTGKIKRKMKKAVNPFYGKKGMGWVKNPKKAMYNKVYNKTTVGVSDLIPKTSHKKKKTTNAGTKPVTPKLTVQNNTSTPTAVNTNKKTVTNKMETSKSVIKKPIIPSPKSKTLAAILCVFGGYLGLHRFYVGKIGTGIFYLLTGGVCGLGWLFDLLCLWVDQFEDKQERTLLSKTKQEEMRGASISSPSVDDLDIHA